MEEARRRAPRWAQWLARHSPLKAALLALGTALLLLVHTMTPATAEHSVLHDLHRQALYIPIILAAFWYGWRGGLAVAALISAVFFPHLLSMMHDQQAHVAMGHGGDFTEAINMGVELALYLVIGGMTGALIDRLRAEEGRLRQANEALAARTDELQAAMDELTRRTREVFAAEEQLRRADRLAAIGQLTTGLAHEIRNPLASIRGAAEILGDGGIGEEQRAEFSRIMLEETQRLDRVLGSFLDYARAQKASGAGAPACAELGRTVESMRTLLGRPLADARVELEVTIEEGLPPLAITCDLLQQVLLNLALNAIQAMAAAGGGRLTIEARREAGRAMTALRVRDTGPGVPAAVAGRIFDPFFTTKAQGLGLGLSIVHKIIAGCGGEIALEQGGDNDQRKGACFVVRLPEAK